MLKLACCASDAATLGDSGCGCMLTVLFRLPCVGVVVRTILGFLATTVLLSFVFVVVVATKLVL